jgi:putative ABC transport system substrate-binding protein
MITRRQLAIGAALLAVAARAGAQLRTYRIGVIYTGAATAQDFRQALFAGLKELGYRPPQYPVVHERYIDGRPDRLPTLVRELADLGVEVIVVGGDLPAQAVKATKPTLPVVMAWSLDPIGSGLAATLARPGGSVTGMAWDVDTEQIAKRLQIFKETVPSIERIAVIWDPTLPGTRAYWPQVTAASKALGIETYSLEVRTESDVKAALEALRKNRPGALFIWSGRTTAAHLKQITDFAIRERFPAFSAGTYDVERGCLMAYSANVVDMFRRAAGFVDKILKGAKPGDLPIELPTKFELVINLKMARAIGLAIPPSILLRADRVIE